MTYKKLRSENRKIYCPITTGNRKITKIKPKEKPEWMRINSCK
jgi:hypothetical protein